MAKNFLPDRDELQQQPEEYFREGNYREAANFYKVAIETEPEVKSHYWNLGLSLLLQGEEAEAQTTWLLGMIEGEPEQVEEWTSELVEILETEAKQREAQEDFLTAWLIRAHIREIYPTHINNLLSLIQVSIALNQFTGEELNGEWEVITLLEEERSGSLDPELLLQTVRTVINSVPLHPSSLELATACLHLLHEHLGFIPALLQTAKNLGYSMHQPQKAAMFAELCLKINPNHPEALQHLATFYQNSGNYLEGIAKAKQFYSLMRVLPDRIFGMQLVLRGLMSAGGYWEDACNALDEYESLLLELVEQQSTTLHPVPVSRLFNATFFFPYFRDQPSRTRLLQNKIAQLCQINTESYAKEQVERYSQRRWNPANQSVQSLKIGYLSRDLRSHSVGWLARWLFQYHDRTRFEIYGYFVGYQHIGDPLQEWYISQVDYAQKLNTDSLAIAEQIYQDNIDILIDLDSLTLDFTGEVKSLKPAPIQVSWLGWDASGLPAVDYFIADPYVLPDSAQNYYSEKIWRLPQTYIAVDGFEVGVPTLRRDLLEIPSDAVVYYSGQRGYKRHPDTARLQMKIIKAVPNSYFLIKGFSEKAAIQKFFYQLAEEEGVECDRLKFLEKDSSEPIHRANLSIADVVLDTYPYNGATTTLETLWMGIPLVTRVGEQFAARNSYTMMMNVGVTEGIAWTDEEYLEWGIRLGEDSALREQISWRLKKSRQVSPLWNARKFTHEMEKAYEQMWFLYGK